MFLEHRTVDNLIIYVNQPWTIKFDRPLFPLVTIKAMC